MIINLSNHHSLGWSNEQLNYAQQKYGTIIDIPFPLVSPHATKSDIEKLATEYTEMVSSYGAPNNIVVHVMGEMTLTYALVTQLKERGYLCLASTTERIVQESVPGEKRVVFKFETFREY